MDTYEGVVPPENEPIATPAPLDRRAVLTSGLIWTGILQVFLVAANFVSMIVLVRLLPPSEYGRAAAATGVLALINCFNCGYFIAQALQLHGGEEPNWDAHWRVGLYIQLFLFIICNVAAVACRFIPFYRPMAGLLVVASLGLLIDCPNQIGLTYLRRDLNYRGQRLVQALATALTVISSIVLAWRGAGAYSLIIGSNVVHGIPFGWHLFAVRKWRPPAKWWQWPDWRGYRREMHFGAQQTGSAVLTAARGILEATVLPATLGFSALGLLNRAQVLFATTGGRLATVVVETIYPLLPRSAGDPQQFSRHATLFVHTMLLISIPGGAFVAIEGPSLSRLLYGSKWIAADPLILPGTVFAWAISTVMIFTTILQAKNQLRLAFRCGLVAAISCLPAMAVAITGGGALRYAWALGIGQAAAAFVAARLATKLLQKKWLRTGVIPAVIAAGAGSLAILMIDVRIHVFRPLWSILIDATVFGFVILLVLRGFFSSLLLEVALRVPGRDFLRRALRV